MIMENNEEILDVEYSSPKLYKRYFATIIDLFLVAIIGMLFLALSSLIVSNVPAFKDMVSSRDTMQVESGLYTEDNQLYTLYYKDNTDYTTLEKKEKLSSILDSFYSNTDYFSDDRYYQSYQNRKKDATYNGESIFVEQNGVYIESSFSDDVYYSFYESELNHYAVSALSLNETYYRYTVSIFFAFVIELLVSFSLSFTVAFLVIPLILKRGHKTLGMYLFHISFISADAINLKTKKYVARFFLVYGIGFLLDIVTVFIPLIVSMFMMHLSKAHQDFFDYVTNTYVVDTLKKDVYLDESEYLRRQKMSQEASIENNDLHIENGL